MFLDSILTASHIDLYRKHWYVAEGDGYAGSEFATDRKAGKYQVEIYDQAYNTTPDANNFHAPASLVNFQGAVIHELTHVALDQNKDIVEAYRKGRQGQIEAWRPFGGGVDCVFPGPCDEEVIARASSTYLLSAKSFRYGLDLLYHDWREEWLGRYATSWYGKPIHALTISAAP